MKLIGSAIVNTVSVAGTALAGVLATAVMARHMSVSDFGRVSILLVAFNGMAVFEGMRPVIIYMVARDETPQAALYASAMRIARALGLAAALLVLAALLSIGSFHLTLPDAALVAVAVSLFFPVATLWGFLDGRAETAFTGAVRATAWIATYGAFALLAIASAPVYAYALSLLAMNAALFVAYAMRWSSVRSPAPARVLPDSDLSRRLGRLAIENVALNGSAVTIGVADRLVVGAALGPAAAGAYSAASEFATKPIAFVRALAQVLSPAAARAATQPGGLEADWLRTTLFAGGVALSGCAAVVLFRAELVTFLLGPKYAAVADVFGVLALSFWMVVLGYGANVYLNAHGDFRTQRVHYAWAAAALVVALYPAIRLSGLIGAAAVYALTRSVDLVLALRVSRDAAPRLWGIRGALLAVTAAATLSASWVGRAWIAAGVALVFWSLAIPFLRAPGATR